MMISIILIDRSTGTNVASSDDEIQEKKISEIT